MTDSTIRYTPHGNTPPSGGTYRTYGTGKDYDWFGGSAAPKIEWTEAEEEETLARPEAETARQQQSRTRHAKETDAPGLRPGAMFAFCVIAVLAVMVLMANMELTRVSAENVAAQSRIESLREENETLRLQAEYVFSLETLEENAVRKLGMTPVPDSRRVVVAAEAEDHGQVLSGADSGIFRLLSQSLGEIGQSVKNVFKRG